MKVFLFAFLANVASASLAPLFPGGPEKIADSYVVVLEDGIDVPAAVEVIESNPIFHSFGGRIKRVYSTALKGFSATLSERALDFVRRLSFVKYVEEDKIFRAASTTSQWGLDRIDQRGTGLDGLYSPKAHGQYVHVYVIDTGINPTHSDFEERVICTNDADFLGGDGKDQNGHGTHCAGIIGGKTHGVANKVTLHSVRVLNSGGTGTTETIIGGMDFVAAERIIPAVASMSLSGPSSQVMDSAVGAMHNAGVTVVVAAGDDDKDACNYSPARAMIALTVASVDQSDTRAPSSNYGFCVDLFAPGVDITSTWIPGDSTYTFTGTSAAAAHVAGGVATLLSLPSPDEVIVELKAATTNNVVSDTKISPNQLLYVGK